ncbi:MAG: T9SS type A sorting domain-containing protein [Muribaculaceae bacterium]|nr:T9SS type A sorting domain-containing protein [Muribaculaceae bacterium]
MRKILLLSLATMAAVSASALEPVSFPDFQVTGISPNGKYVVADLYGNMQYYNTETGQMTKFEGDSEDAYSAGMGNCVSANGIVVGEVYGRPSYLKGGEWTNLKVINAQFSNLANAISADATRICGSLGTAPVSLDDTEDAMLVPAYWDLQEDGTYGDPVFLPRPEKDFTGRVPQYITANAISADGKTIVGSVTDYAGMMIYMIWYTQNDEGKWSYTLAPKAFYNPNDVVFPEYPGEGPQAPTMEDFMTEEELNAYQTAIEEWEASGDWDYSKYPLMENFMTDEEKAQYDMAVTKYQAEYAEWEVKNDAFMEVYSECVESGHPLTFNNIIVSADGKMAYSSSLQGGFFSPLTGGSVTINLENSEYTVSDNLVMPSTVAADGTLFGSINNRQDPGRAVVIAAGSTEAVDIIDWIKPRAPKVATWIKENMYHDMESYEYDDNTGDYIPVTVEGVNCTGTPFCSTDMSVIASQTPNYWDYDIDTMVFGYIFPTTDDSAVRTVAAAKLGVRAYRGGVVELNGVCDLMVYDIQGRLVYASNGVEGSVATNLPAGTYLVKAVGANETKVVKTTF